MTPKKLFLSLICALTCILMSAQGTSTKISVSFNNVPLRQAINQIESKSQYSFFYDASSIDLDTKVSVQATNEDVSSVIGRMLSPTTLSFTIKERQIALFPKQVKQVVPNNQEKTIKGYVLDQNGDPLPGATVQIEGSDKGVLTNLDGAYEIKVAPSQDLTYSFIGMQPQTVRIANQTILNVELSDDNTQIDEAVAVAFGTQKKESIVGAIATVKVDNLKAPTSNLTTTLAGNVAGIISYQRTGEPGEDDASFFIRGVTTFGNNKNPLILIDNIELTTTDLARLSPDDIDSFSIMKDATATALYGSRAANGVILVKTKEGRKGKAKVNIRYEHSFSQPTQEVELEEDPRVYMRLHNEAIKTRNASALPLYSDIKIKNTDPDKPSYLYPYTNWHDELLKSVAQNDRANLNVSGGGDVARYYVAASGKHDTGILNVNGVNNYNNNIDLTTYTLRSNVNVNITRTTELVIRLSGTFDQYQGPISGGSATYKQIMSANPVLFPAYYPSELLPFSSHVLYGNFNDSYLNPYAEMTKGYKEYGRSNMGAQFELTQKFDFITKGLKFRALLNTNRISYYEMSRYCKPFYYNYIGTNPDTGIDMISCINPEGGTDYLVYSEDNKTINTSTYIEAALNYNREFGLNGVSGMLVYQFTDKRQPNASTLQASLPFRNIGLSGRFTYDFGKRYFAEFNFGYNGSERFSKDKRFGFFPSAGLGWLISNEKFFAPLKDKVTNLKLRASYGLVGNDNIGATRFLYLSQVNMNDANYSYRFGSINGGYSKNGVSISRYANPEVGWEVAKKANVALEFGWKNALNIVTEVYSEYRDNILQTRAAIPASMGLASIPEANVGAAKGHGVDVEFNYNKSFANNSWLQARGNFTYAKSQYVRYEEVQYPDAPWKSHKGYSVNQQWGYVAESLFIDDLEVKNSPKQFGNYLAGDLKYIDVNKDGIIDQLDQVPIGYPTTPEIVYGFGFSYGIKGFDLSVFFQGLARESFWIDYNSVSPFFNTVSGMTGNNQLAKFISDSHWSEETRNIYSVWPRLSEVSIDNNAKTNTWFMRNGAFLRLKQVEFGYTIPHKVSRKAGMESLRIYFSGSNLLCFSKFKLWDPEMAGNGLGYPLQRVFNIGINVNF